MTDQADYDPTDLNLGKSRPRVAALLVVTGCLVMMMLGAHFVLDADLQAHWASMQLPDSPFFTRDPTYPDWGSLEHSFRGDGLRQVAMLMGMVIIITIFALLRRPTPQDYQLRARFAAIAVILMMPLGAGLAFLFSPSSWTDQTIEVWLAGEYLWVLTYPVYCLLAIAAFLVANHRAKAKGDREDHP